jgi:alpha-mannosidase
MPPRTIHLICNAHLDPVWLWEWEEGAATAISTFRTAADLCEQFPGFVFNHNEVILYQWVEEYDPALFARIQCLVAEGKWHIMGGWHIQPDCNMPSGESFVRQILIGRRYFAEKFGARPTTAINFDPFGHTRGLVQIMAKSGYDSYLVCRPSKEDAHTPGDEFVWEGYDGSRVTVLRPFGWYNSALGQVRHKTENFIANGPQDADTLMLWGVGNHGGGPSRQDLADLSEMIAADYGGGGDVEIRHSTPEAYFAAIRTRIPELPIHRADMNPWAIGCYTSMVRVKQGHRRLENELYAAEKMSTAAWAQGRMTYPKAELAAALYDLATCEFHDILPGSSIQPAEEMALRILDHGLENTARVKARAFFALAHGQPAAKPGEIPVLVYNPHPYPVQTVVECEFNLADFNPADDFTDLQAYAGEAALPTQVEHELSSLNMDWRKRVAFAATLAPSQMNRFVCRARPTPLIRTHPQPEGHIHFQTEQIEVIINTRTGLLDAYRVAGVDYLAANACNPLVMLDDPDPWGMRGKSYRNLLGAFSLLSSQENQRFSAVTNPALPAVRIIEDGDVRTVIEVVLGYADSRIVLRYKLPKHGTEIEIEVRVHWNEKDRLLKLAFPTPDKHAVYMGQVAFGVDELPSNGNEAVAQKWVAVVSRLNDNALTIINDGIYGSDCCYGEARLSLLRSPGYSVHPIGDRPLLPDDRYSPRQEQGERLYHFWLNAGPLAARLAAIDREALAHNEKPMALSFFPLGDGAPLPPYATLSDDVIQLSALKPAESDEGVIVRLFNPTADERRTVVTLPGTTLDVNLHPYEIRTYCLKGKQWVETNLVEEMSG